MSRHVDRNVETVDCVVVGAGLSGLAHALRRTREGRSVRVLEAASGVDEAEAARIAGGCVVLDEAVHLEALLASLPGTLSLEEGGPVLLADGRGGVRPLPRRGLAPWRKAPRGSPDACADTLGRFARRHLGVRTTARGLAPWVRFGHGVSPDEVGAAETAPSLVVRASGRRALATLPRPRMRRLVPGLPVLLEQVAAQLTDPLRTDTRVIAIGRATENEATGPVVEVRTGEGVRWRAREVALAVSAGEQARLLLEEAPHEAEVLGAVGYAPVVDAFLALASVAGSPPTLDATLLPGPGARVRILGAVFGFRDPAGAQGPARVLVRLGGSGDPEAVDLSDAWIGSVARSDLARLLHMDVGVRLLTTRRYAVPMPAPGHRARLAGLIATLAPRGIRLLGRHVLGTSLDARAAAAVPVRGPVPEGTQVA